ncbi:MAG TPA: HAD-IA family hydrolase [Elusimicrobiota bacterium]|nr:HAD-IA family hydrolase [Elusimicrobiota bacterium]
MPSDRFSDIRVIFFDAGGTLFRPYPSVGDVYAVTAARHGVSVSAAQVETEFHKVWHLRNGMTSLTPGSDPSATRGLTPVQTSEKIERDWWYALVRDVFGNLSAFRDFDDFFEELYDSFARAECWRLFDDTIPTLEALRRAGFRLGVISNWDHRLFSIVDQLGLAHYFEHVTASSAVGIAKPGKGIFESALRALKAEPEHSLHIGDSLIDDYLGARAAGLRSVLLDRHRKPYNDVVLINRLTELVALLKPSKSERERA